MNHIIAQAIIAFLLSNQHMNPDKIHILLLISEPYIHRKVLTEEEIELYCDQLENLKDI